MGNRVAVVIPLKAPLPPGVALPGHPTIVTRTPSSSHALLEEIEAFSIPFPHPLHPGALAAGVYPRTGQHRAQRSRSITQVYTYA